ncbi:HK97 gp10 family phage protein [Geomonas terrae]|uniref:HK97 gp10 family phage protein n=1 Tax=Geomonas terrae TaxID=2562681 RepID=A0A4S1CMR8_9BACT|nr:HK97 gp10 family phage protein [Geomonas terrae]TGU75107.1 HK97 gp10 family phage protein [Geomonas terrae]
MGFADDISKWTQKAKGQMEVAIRATAFEAFKRVILRSPVDTGRFRANWGVSVGSPWLGNVAYVDPSGQTAMGEAAKGVDSWNCQGSIFLCNSTEYGQKLEYGSSKQAPQGMVRVTAAEFEGFAAEVAVRSTK